METDVITIDGPTSSGKNSVGFLLAQKLGYQYIDTGMIYRAGCYALIKNNVSLDDEEKTLEAFRNLNVEFKKLNGSWKVFSSGEDVTDILHTSQISKITSSVASMPKVREIMRGIQRKIGSKGKIVMSGRDIGSEIFPDAKFKFFLTASVEVRARRRFEQLEKNDPGINYDTVLKDMLERDKNDSERETSPMRIPKDAVVLDNSNLTVDETAEEILKRMKSYA